MAMESTQGARAPWGEQLQGVGRSADRLARMSFIAPPVDMLRIELEILLRRAVLLLLRLWWRRLTHRGERR